VDEHRIAKSTPSVISLDETRQGHGPSRRRFVVNPHAPIDRRPLSCGRPRSPRTAKNASLYIAIGCRDSTA